MIFLFKLAVSIISFILGIIILFYTYYKTYDEENDKASLFFKISAWITCILFFIGLHSLSVMVGLVMYFNIITTVVYVKYGRRYTNYNEEHQYTLF